MTVEKMTVEKMLVHFAFCPDCEEENFVYIASSRHYPVCEVCGTSLKPSKIDSVEMDWISRVDD